MPPLPLSTMAEIMYRQLTNAEIAALIDSDEDTYRAMNNLKHAIGTLSYNLAVPPSRVVGYLSNNPIKFL